MRWISALSRTPDNYMPNELLHLKFKSPKGIWVPWIGTYDRDSKTFYADQISPIGIEQFLRVKWLCEDEPDQEAFKPIQWARLESDMISILLEHKDQGEAEIIRHLKRHYNITKSRDKEPSDKFKHCNHHHELTDNHEIVDYGHGEFVANKTAIPLLKALNEAGLRTRTHHYDGNPAGAFISIILDDHVRLEIKEVNETDADRTQYNGQKELLILWEPLQKK